MKPANVRSLFIASLIRVVDFSVLHAALSENRAVNSNLAAFLHVLKRFLAQDIDSMDREVATRHAAHADELGFRRFAHDFSSR